MWDDSKDQEVMESRMEKRKGIEGESKVVIGKEADATPKKE